MARAAAQRQAWKAQPGAARRLRLDVGWELARRDSAQQLFERQQSLRVDQLEQAQFQMKALLLAIVQIVEGAQYNLKVAGQFFFSEEKRGACGAGAFIAADLQQLRLCAAQFGHQCVAQVADHLAGQGRGAVAGVDQQIQLLHQFGALPGGDGFQQPLEDRVGHRAHQLANLRGGEHGAAIFKRRGCDGLIHDRQRVSH
jgi:hypothetical protein